MKQSIIGAGLVLVSAIPIGDVLDALGFLGGGADAGTAAAEGAGAADEGAAEEEAAASCGGESFTAGTRVLLASGAAVPIASLKPGEKVLATNARTGKTQAEAVTAVLVHHDTDLYDLTIRSGGRTEVIHTTTTHLFWDPYPHYG